MKSTEIKLKFLALLLIFILATITIVRCDPETGTTGDEPTDEDYEQTSGDYDYEATKPNNESLVQSIGGASNDENIDSSPRNIAIETASQTTITETTIVSLTPATTCLSECSCTDNLQIINCSNRLFDEIPNGLPPQAIRIDLSENRLEHFDVAKLQHCRQLRELILRKNSISSIDNLETFKELRQLEFIDLTSNRLKSLKGSEFFALENLRNISFAHNHDVVDTETRFNSSSLLKINLTDCNVIDLNEKIFAGTQNLTSLSLNKNPNLNVNVDVFQSVTNLQSLQLPTVEQPKIFELCNILTSIDLINLTDYDVSCFTLTVGGNFEESIIRPGTTTEATKEDYDDPFIKALPVSEEDITLASAKKMQPTRTPVDEPKSVDIDQRIDSTSQNGSRANSTKSSKSDDEEVKRVNISNQSLKAILISIIVITMIGLVIGIICRMDIFGIKTKLCRTRRRQTPTDQVRPTEAIPLNKV